MPILFLIILGTAAGFVATRIMRVQAGLASTIAIGVGGALIGGLVLRGVGALAGMASGSVGAILGALLLLWIWGKLKGNS